MVLYTGYGTNVQAVGEMRNLGEGCMGSGQIQTLWEILRKPVDHTKLSALYGPQAPAVCGWHYKINAATPGVWVAGKS